MNEYIIPVRYQNVGCGISVKVAGLETNRENYKQISLSIDNVYFIDTQLNETNLDISNILTFDNLEENKYYMIYGKITLTNDEIMNISAKVPSQIQTATVEVPFEIRKRRYLGGLLIKDEGVI